MFGKAILVCMNAISWYVGTHLLVCGKTVISMREDNISMEEDTNGAYLLTKYTTDNTSILLNI